MMENNAFLSNSHIQRIMDAAENAAMLHDKERCNDKFIYFDAKKMLEPFDVTTTEEPKKFDDRSLDPPNVTVPRIILTENSNFYNNKVNTSLSSVHVPTNVYARGKLLTSIWFSFNTYTNLRLISLVACDVIKDIQWSQNLDRVFLDNYKIDPTLSWQFFGSSTGFMRQFPGIVIIVNLAMNLKIIFILCIKKLQNGKRNQMMIQSIYLIVVYVHGISKLLLVLKIWLY